MGGQYDIARTILDKNADYGMLDVCCNEDAGTLRKDHVPQNLSLLKKIAQNLTRPVAMV